jgi:hypothetical protein
MTSAGKWALMKDAHFGPYPKIRLALNRRANLFEQTAFNSI